MPMMIQISLFELSTLKSQNQKMPNCFFSVPLILSQLEGIPEPVILFISLEGLWTEETSLVLIYQV